MFPEWRVVTLRDNVIVAERTFHDEERSRVCKYCQTRMLENMDTSLEDKVILSEFKSDVAGCTKLSIISYLLANGQMIYTAETVGNCINSK